MKFELKHLSCSIANSEVLNLVQQKKTLITCVIKKKSSTIQQEFFIVAQGSESDVTALGKMIQPFLPFRRCSLSLFTCNVSTAVLNYCQFNLQNERFFIFQAEGISFVLISNQCGTGTIFYRCNTHRCNSTRCDFHGKKAAWNFYHLHAKWNAKRTCNQTSLELDLKKKEENLCMC